MKHYPMVPVVLTYRFKHGKQEFVLCAYMKQDCYHFLDYDYGIFGAEQDAENWINDEIGINDGIACDTVKAFVGTLRRQGIGPSDDPEFLDRLPTPIE